MVFACAAIVATGWAVGPVRSRPQADRPRPAHRTLPVGSDRARELWDERGLEWRRNLISSVVDRVVVGPGVRGLNRFDPRRVVILWSRASNTHRLGRGRWTARPSSLLVWLRL